MIAVKLAKPKQVSVFERLASHRVLLFLAPVIVVAVETVVLKIATDRGHWEIFEVAPAAIANSSMLSVVCSFRLAYICGRPGHLTSTGYRVAVFFSCVVGQVVLSCVLASGIFAL